MIKPLIRMGNPILRRLSDLVSREMFSSDYLKGLSIDMVDSMKHYGGIGIAAPQIGVNLQVAVIDLPTDDARYGQEQELKRTFFVNPTLQITDPTLQGFWEGCLSVPGLRGYVERAQGVRVEYFDLDGHPQVLEANGFLSTVIQHELDHLFGKIYVDRITDMTKFSYQEEFSEFHVTQLEKELDE